MHARGNDALKRDKCSNVATEQHAGAAMGRRAAGAWQLYRTAETRDLKGVLASLTIVASEHLRAGMALPEWMPAVLRQWTLLERGQLQYAPTAEEEADDAGSSAAELAELVAVLQQLPGAPPNE